jgi:hypothetical protein
LSVITNLEETEKQVPKCRRRVFKDQGSEKYINLICGKTLMKNRVLK